MIRTDHEGEIHRLLGECSDDEVRVVHAILRRVHRARREYGPLRLGTDARDFHHEAACEAFDALFYLAIEDVRRQRQEPPFPVPPPVTDADLDAMAQAHTAADRVRRALHQAKEGQS